MSLKIAIITVALLVCTSAVAKPIEIDLTPERKEYEAKALPRNIGLSLLAGTLVLGVVSVYGYSSASSSKTELLAQAVPVDLARRQELVASGQRSNAIGLGGALLGLSAAIGSAYFLAVSF